MHVLITGSTGLIGNQLVRALISRGDQVSALSRAPLNQQSELLRNELVDFEDEIDIDDITGQVDAIVHLAQSQKFRDFPAEAPDIFSTNVRSTVALLDWARRSGVKHFIYASTGGVYADSARYLEASTPLKTPGELDFYFSTKLASEAFVQCYSGEFSVAVMRFFFVYGPKQNRSMLLPRIFDRVKNDEDVFLAGDDGFRFNPIHVSDAVLAIQASLNDPRSLVTNVAGPEVLSLREVSEIFGSYLGKTPRFVMTGKLAADVVGDTSYMFENLFKSTKTLGEMVADLGV